MEDITYYSKFEIKDSGLDVFVELGFLASFLMHSSRKRLLKVRGALRMALDIRGMCACTHRVQLKRKT